MRILPALLLLTTLLVQTAACDRFFTPRPDPYETAPDADVRPDPAPDATPREPTAPLVSWAASAGGVELDSGKAVAALPDGGAILAGSFRGTFTAGRAESSETVLVAVANDDAFIARYDHTGALSWAKHAGGAGWSIVSDVDAFPDGSAVVTGWFSERVVFGRGEPGETALQSVGSHDVFVARYNGDGTLAWAKRAGGRLSDRGSSVSISAGGTIVVAGIFAKTEITPQPAAPTTFGAGEANETVVEASGNADTFVAAYAGDGSLVWVSPLGSPHSELPKVSAFADGGCVLVGSLRGVVVVGAGHPGEAELVSGGGPDVLVTRFDSTGSMMWARRSGGSFRALPSGVATHDDGSAVVVGWFEGVANFGVGEPAQTTFTVEGGVDLFVTKYGVDGDVAWVRQISSVLDLSTASVAGLTGGGVTVVGQYHAQNWSSAKPLTFAAGEPSELTLPDPRASAVFVARFDSDGAIDRAKYLGSGFVPTDLDAVADGSSVLSGNYHWLSPLATGEPGPPLPTTAGSSDAFVLRLGP